jgi:hypothetical protein
VTSGSAREERERASLVDRSDAPDLAPVFAAALAVARNGVTARPYVPVPERLRPYLRNPHPTVRVWAAIHEVLDTDDEFRGRVRDAVSADEVGPAGWLFLARPDGWSTQLAAALDPACETGVGEAPPRDASTATVVGAEVVSGPPAHRQPVPPVDTTQLAADVAERISFLRAELGELRAARIRLTTARSESVPAAGAPVDDATAAAAGVPPAPAEEVPPLLPALSAAAANVRQLADQLAVLVASFDPDVLAPGPRGPGLDAAERTSRLIQGQDAVEQGLFWLGWWVAAWWWVRGCSTELSC